MIWAKANEDVRHSLFVNIEKQFYFQCLTAYGEPISICRSLKLTKLIIVLKNVQN